MMRGLGIRSVFRGVVAVAALLAVSFVRAEEKPAWDITVSENELATFEAVQLHPKEKGWLLTCRMRVKSLNFIEPISEIDFVGLNVEEEEVWEKSHTVRRKDFDAAYGGGRNQFLRVFLNGVPAEVVTVELRYGLEEHSE
ncbi:hypothetical protein [Pelagicoccus sp. SDUM812002]|uniref:hypothetical protein n=1 Tax=Pelagicoccus sp. SDUM812002 TaxID=3041266 RepID=UPI00280D50AB|nr:hypothetical protein [Pelagicoccus sp. SDUM812002]MDQ8185850.1 hypothetical protein [Pelagicoccus sp. SDUM812002]